MWYTHDTDLKWISSCQYTAGIGDNPVRIARRHHKQIDYSDPQRMHHKYRSRIVLYNRYTRGTVWMALFGEKEESLIVLCMNSESDWIT